MVFSSILFIFYFVPFFFGIYFLLPKKFKNAWLIFSSLLFYWWGAPTFIFVLLSSCFIDYFAAIYFSRNNNKLIYLTAIVSNVALLLYFKYFNFFIDNIKYIIGEDIEYTKVVLPIGISFLTFQKISYLIDVKRKHAEPQQHLGRYLLFVTLFPQLIAGPIVRYKEISSQLLYRFKEITTTNIYLGLRRFIIGLAKKVLIANILGEVVDQVFELPLNEISSFASILGLVAYTFQIYFDFSGYSDMAIGLGKMLGFTFPENFNFPYIAKNITEFWRRWHITLGSWMRDYLYIPLGGNKKGIVRTYINLILVFLISGLWHGASWNFVIWGAYHGFFLVVERLFLLKITTRLPLILAVIYNFSIVSIGWLFFRSENLTEALNYFANFSNFDTPFRFTDEIFTVKFYTIFIFAIIFSFMGLFGEKLLNEINNKLNSNSFSMGISHASIIILLVLSLSELFSSDFNPFIYFKF
jgi:alginate O-acetyltransferase complex protein AlgI